MILSKRGRSGVSQPLESARKGGIGMVRREPLKGRGSRGRGLSALEGEGLDLLALVGASQMGVLMILARKGLVTSVW